jgi:hypothetical protein
MLSKEIGRIQWGKGNKKTGKTIVNRTGKAKLPY